MRICYHKAKFSKKKLIGAGIVLLVVAIIGMKFAPAYVQERLHADIWNDINGNGYQQSQALIGIANGGWFGKGPGYGFLHNVFAHENDIVFATISEEWGLLYALMMVLAILIIVMLPLINPPRSYFHSTRSPEYVQPSPFRWLLYFRLMHMIPFTGVTIPFISSGGSSLMTSGFMTGMLVASQSPVFKPPKPHKKISSFNLRRRKA